jgi:hypothetical protein
MILRPDLAESIFTGCEDGSDFAFYMTDIMRALHPKKVFINRINNLERNPRSKMDFIDSVAHYYFRGDDQLQSQAKNINKGLRYHFCQTPTYPDYLPMEIDRREDDSSNVFESLDDVAETEVETK